MSVIKYDEFPCASTVFKPPHKIGALYKSEAVFAADGGDEPVYIQLPAMQVTDLVADGQKAFVELRVTDNDLTYLLREIDHHTSSFVFKNRAQWFPAASLPDINVQFVEAAYKPPLIVREAGSFLRLRLNVNDGEVKTRVFEDRALRPFDYLAPGRLATAVVQFCGLTMHKESIAPDLVVHSIKLSPERTHACLL
jgi:hypothetical protein